MARSCPLNAPSSHRPCLQLLASVCGAAAKTIVITVGGNTTNNGTTTFVPQRVDAALGDVVLFNCKFLRLTFFGKNLTGIAVTDGNHTATESTFSKPCIPAHETNTTINGFDSGYRDTQPDTVGSSLAVPIIIQNENHTFWFFDYNTCGEGGVGVINNNESSNETLAGFVVRISVFTSRLVGSVTRGVSFFSHSNLAFCGANAHYNAILLAECYPPERHKLLPHY